MTHNTILYSVPAIALAACTTPTSTADPQSNLPVSYAGYSGEYASFELVIDERFDSFDTALWRSGDGAVGGESMCRFQPEGIRIEDGSLKLIVDKQDIAPSWSDDHAQDKGPYDYVCGELRTRDDRLFHYGRFEARIKAPDRTTASGYISSLFTYRFDKDPNTATPHDIEWEEIDVELEGGRPDKFQANLIYGLDTWEWWRTRQFGAWEDKIDIAPADEWRVYAIEWLPDAIRWYVDGDLVRTLSANDIDCDPACIAPQEKPTPIPDNPTTVLMNFWIPTDNIQDHFGGNKERNVYPMTTEYDWFRYYEWTG